MTDLTEQLKKGELPEGFYYFKLPNGETDTGKDFGLAILLMCEDGDKIEVLSEVPSYEQWQAKLEENAQLKELLKRVVNVTDFYHEIKIASVIDYRVWYNIAKEINQVLGEDK